MSKTNELSQIRVAPGNAKEMDDEDSGDGDVTTIHLLDIRHGRGIHGPFMQDLISCRIGTFGKIFEKEPAFMYEHVCGDGVCVCVCVCVRVLLSTFLILDIGRVQDFDNQTSIRLGIGKHLLIIGNLTEITTTRNQSKRHK